MYGSPQHLGSGGTRHKYWCTSGWLCSHYHSWKGYDIPPVAEGVEDVTWGEQRQGKEDAAVFVAACEGEGDGESEGESEGEGVAASVNITSNTSIEVVCNDRNDWSTIGSGDDYGGGTVVLVF